MTSPTFTLVRSYPCAATGRRGARRPATVRTFLHADLYRLEHLGEVVDLALAELVEDDAVAVVEWGDVAEPVLGDDAITVRLAEGAHDDERCVTIDVHRVVARRRRDELRRAPLGVDDAMMVLAVESSTELAGVALADEAGVLATVTVSRGRHHAESIAPAIEFVCRRAGVAPVGRSTPSGVDVGPGLFTGLRVGVGTAKALAFALERPLVTCGSLEVLAQAVATSGIAPGHARRPRRRRPARRGLRGRPRAPPVGRDVGAARAASDPRGAGRRARAPRRADGAGRATGPAGTGRYWVRCPVRCAVARFSTSRRPGVLATVVGGEGGRGWHTDVDAVLPHYLRDAETRINWETRAPRAGVER